MASSSASPRSTTEHVTFLYQYWTGPQELFDIDRLRRSLGVFAAEYLSDDEVLALVDYAVHHALGWEGGKNYDDHVYVYYLVNSWLGIKRENWLEEADWLTDEEDYEDMYEDLKTEVIDLLVRIAARLLPQALRFMENGTCYSRIASLGGKFLSMIAALLGVEPPDSQPDNACISWLHEHSLYCDERIPLAELAQLPLWPADVKMWAQEDEQDRRLIV